MDEHLVKVGFMGPAEAEAFVSYLEGFGFRLLGDGSFADIAIFARSLAPPDRAPGWSGTGTDAGSPAPMRARSSIWPTRRRVAWLQALWADRSSGSRWATVSGPVSKA
jgi:hypothetical protein